MTPATRRAVLWLVALAFALRVAARVTTGAADFWVNGYTLLFSLAQNIAAGKGLTLDGVHPTAFRMPLYPLFLAAVTGGRQSFLPVVIAQALIGAATVWCAGLLAAEMFGANTSGKVAAIAAAAITAIYPYYVVHDTALQETSLFTLLTLLSVILLLRARRSGSGITAVWAGLVLGADVLTRATIAPFAVFAALWLFVKRPRAALICAVVLALTVAPWLLRSYRLTGFPTFTTETGLELWNGNNPLTFSHYPRESSDLSKAAALDALTPAENSEMAQSDSEAAVDGWFWRKGMSYIRDHPWYTIANGLRKIGAAFGFLPSPRRSFWPNLVYALSYGPVLLLGLYGMWLRRRHFRDDALIFGGFVWFCVITAVFFGHTSHRSYLDVYLIVFAAGAWAERRGTRAAAPGHSARSPEQQLLLYCAGADEVDGDRVSALVQKGAENGMDWDALADAAEYHGLAPSLYRNIECISPELIPENVAGRLRDRYRESAKQNLIFTTKLLALLDAFDSEGIAVVPLKGPVLAESLYPDPVMRPFSDLDLLVRKQDVPAALQLLTREGYSLGPHLARLPLDILLRLNFELLLRQDRSAQVDLQWETGPADYPFRFDTEILWRSLTRVRIAGREVPSLSQESLLLFLCVHGAKHVWSRLQWLGDVTRLARSEPDWKRTLDLATETRCVRPLLLGLLLAHELLEAPVPETILERARADDTVQQLAREVEVRLNRSAPVEPESLEITTFNARMAERAWDKVRHYAALLKAPTESELELIALPPKLFFLYYPIRAVRLATKYASRMARG